MLNLLKPCVSFVWFQEEMIFTPFLAALHIEVEVVQWVYSVGPKKVSASMIDAPKIMRCQNNGFSSSPLDMFETSSIPCRTQMLVQAVPKEPINLFEKTLSNIALTIFAANVEVQLNDKMKGELLRSTLKKAPSRLRYELIYVSSTVVQRVLNIGS